MFQKRSLMAILAFILIVTALLPGQVSANSERITRGDVQAVFNAFINGGWAIMQNNGTGNGAPADEFGSRGAIRPFGGSLFDGSHHCVDDWHVLLVAYWDGGTRSEKNQDIFDRIDQQVIDMYLDGEELDTERTPIKRFLNQNALDNYGFDKGFAFQTGKIMSPDELSVGMHTLKFEADGVFGPYESEIEFYIDDSNSPTCTG